MQISSYDVNKSTDFKYQLECGRKKTGSFTGEVPAHEVEQANVPVCVVAFCMKYNDCVSIILFDAHRGYVALFW